MTTDIKESALDYHRLPVAGKIAVETTKRMLTQHDLSLAYTHLWTNGLSAGRGWIAVALVIFAFWRPWRAMLGAYLFGGVMAFQFRMQATGTHLPSSLLLMLPYALTIAVLVLSSWRGRSIGAPASLGINIEPPD